MNDLSAADILGASDIKTEPVEVPEWNGTVHLRGLTGKQRDAYEASMRKLERGEYVQDLSNACAKLLVRCIVDANGKRLFADDDAAKLGDKSADVILRLFGKARELSGMGDDEEDAAVENLDETATDGSTSSSPESSA